MTSRGVSGTGGDLEGNDSAIFPPPHAGHRDHCVGWQPTPPVMPPLRHFCGVGGPSQPALKHHSVLKCRGEEVTPSGYVRVPGGHRDSVQGVWTLASPKWWPSNTLIAYSRPLEMTGRS